MATRVISTSLQLDGEQEFKRQLSDVNGELRNLKSEMTLTTEEFKGNANSMEALQAKSKILRQEMEQQQEKVRALEQAVQDSSEVYGDADKHTDKYRQSLNRAKTDLIKMQRELDETDQYMDEAEKSTDKVAKSIDGFGRQVKDTGDDVDDLGGEIGGLGGDLKGLVAGGSIAAVAGGLKAVADAVLEVEESTREYRKIMGTLEESSQQAGYMAGQTQEAYEHLYGVLGDSQTTATTVANLQAINLEQGDLMDLIDSCTGAWARYGDSIPIDGLAESINETIQSGEVTGTLADVLNWASTEGETFGVKLKDNVEFTKLSNKELENMSEKERAAYEEQKKLYEQTEAYNGTVEDATTAEDLFNIALGDCKDKSERANKVLQLLSDQGLTEAGQAWRDLNDDIIDAHTAQDEMEQAMAGLGEALEPAATKIREFGAGAIRGLTKEIEKSVKTWERAVWFFTGRKPNDYYDPYKDYRPEERYETAISSSAGGRYRNGSHANGLDYVPFDGYLAELHRGEAVITAAEAAAMRSFGKIPASLGGETALSQSSTESLVTGIVNGVAAVSGGASSGAQTILVPVYLEGVKIAEAVYDPLKDIRAQRGD